MRFPDALATLGGLARDAAGGANLALAMLPKAMAYAAVAGVPPAYGLYASCAAPALAVAFGSNRLLFTGPVGVMTVLVLGALHHFAHPYSRHRRLHRSGGAPHHRHAGGPRAGRAASVRARGHPSPRLPG